MKKNFYLFFTFLSLLFTLSVTMNVSAIEIPEEPTYQSDSPLLDIEKK